MTSEEVKEIHACYSVAWRLHKNYLFKAVDWDAFNLECDELIAANKHQSLPHLLYAVARDLESREERVSTRHEASPGQTQGKPRANPGVEHDAVTEQLNFLLG